MPFDCSCSALPTERPFSKEAVRLRAFTLIRWQVRRKTPTKSEQRRCVEWGIVVRLKF